MDTEEYDEWMLESISLYKDLHDFELQDPTRVIEWIGDKSICVAGYDSCKRNEILQLLVPQRLNAKQNQGLCPERDLKVEHGGFSDYPVYSLIRIPDSNLLLTSGPGTDKVQVWQIGAEDNDVIKPVSTVTSEAGSEMWPKLATTASTSPRVLHGSQANGVQLTEIETSKPIYTLGVTSSDAIGTLSFLDCNTFHLCCVNGRQYIADVRQPQVCAEGCVAPALLSSVQWCAAVKPGLPETSCHIASLSSEGHVTVTDSRDLSEPLKCAKLKFSDPAPTNHFLCVRWAPVLDNCISVSGLDGTVQIYDTQSWDATLQAQDAVFIHKGHSVLGTCNGAGSLPRITAHAWHPWKERIVLSAATDGSFHVWDWTDSQTKRQHNS